MIKSVFAIVFLLHFCCNAEINFNLNVEIMDRLAQLNGLHKQKEVNITSSGPLRVPGTDMNNHASSCVGNFTRELKHLLNNVSVSEQHKNLLKELKANLQDLEPHQHIGHKCVMTPVRNITMVFKNYIRFLRKLNNSKKR